MRGGERVHEREAGSAVIEGGSRIAQGKELSLGSVPADMGFPYAVLHLMFAKAVLLINLGDLNCSSSESE